MSTHRADEDNSNHNLEESVTPGGPTRPHGRVEAESGESDTVHMLHMDQRWRGSDTEPQNAKTKALESIEDECAHLDSSATTSQAMTCHIGQLLERSATTTLTGHHTDHDYIHLSII